MRRKNTRAVRTATTLGAVVLAAVGYYTHAGLGNISSFGWGAISFLCPLGALESTIAAKTLIPHAVVSLAIVVALLVLLGGFFCSWVCPIPVLQRWFPDRREKRRERAERKARAAEAAVAEGLGAPAVGNSENPGADASGGCAPSACGSCGSACVSAKARANTFKLDSRHGVLLGALLSTAVFGFPVFCLVCPVGLTFATVMLVMRLFSFGETTWTLLLFPAIIVLEVLLFRKWCGKICPLGAFVSLVAGLNRTFRPVRDESKCLQSEGVNCRACAKACPQGINLVDPAEFKVALNNCTKCRECADVCPRGAISFPFLPGRAVEQNAPEAKPAYEEAR